MRTIPTHAITKKYYENILLKSLLKKQIHSITFLVNFLLKIYFILLEQNTVHFHYKIKAVVCHKSIP